MSARVAFCLSRDHFQTIPRHLRGCRGIVCQGRCFLFRHHFQTNPRHLRGCRGIVCQGRFLFVPRPFSDNSATPGEVSRNCLPGVPFVCPETIFKQFRDTRRGVAELSARGAFSVSRDHFQSIPRHPGGVSRNCLPGALFGCPETIFRQFRDTCGGVAELSARGAFSVPRDHFQTIPRHLRGCRGIVCQGRFLYVPRPFSDNSATPGGVSRNCQPGALFLCPQTIFRQFRDT